MQVKKSIPARTGKRRCADVVWLHSTPASPLLTKEQWKEIITWFLLNRVAINIAIATSIEREEFCGLSLSSDGVNPGCSRGLLWNVEVDETYLGGQWKNKRKTIREEGTKRGRVPRNNQFLESSVVMELYGPKWWMMLNHDRYNTYHQAGLPGFHRMFNTWRGVYRNRSKGFVHRLVNHGRSSIAMEREIY